jgi:hypothetical protein
MEEARLSFYDLREFGIYRWGGARLFGEVPQILQELQHWSVGKTISETKTYDTGRGGQVLPSYFLSLHEARGTFLLGLWNETPSTDGAVASISENAPVGTTRVTMNEIEEGSIPGVATYFWFVPGSNVVATVRFHHPGTGISQMRTYLRMFMERFCSHAVTDENDGELVTVGYREHADSEVFKARPKIALAPHRRDAERQIILDRAPLVRKIEKKGVLMLTARDDRAVWQKLLHAFHIDEPTVRPHEVKMSYEVEVEGLTEAEVAAVMDSYDEEDGQNDYGFKFAGDAQVHWLGKEVARDTLTLDVRHLNPEMINPDDLIRELDRHRRRLLALL